MVFHALGDKESGFSCICLPQSPSSLEYDDVRSAAGTQYEVGLVPDNDEFYWGTSDGETLDE